MRSFAAEGRRSRGFGSTIKPDFFERTGLTCDQTPARTSLRDPLSTAKAIVDGACISALLWVLALELLH